MKNILGLIIVLVICFTNCEGRKTSRQALSKSIEEFNKKVNFETKLYIPEMYMQNEVDTLISNGFQVKIKNYNDMNKSVLFSKIKDTINYQTYYRNFKFEISVIKNNTLIYSEIFDKNRVNNDFNYSSKLHSGSDFYNFDKLAVLKYIEVNDDPSYKDKVLIDILFAIPESDRSASHRLVIDQNGKSNIIQVEVN